MLDTFNLFSERLKKRKNAGKPVLYKYDEIPVEFRRQVIHIWFKYIGSYSQDPYSGQNRNRVWHEFHDTLANHYGEFELGKGFTPLDKLQDFFLNTNELEKLMDVIELTLAYCKPRFLLNSGFINHLQQQKAAEIPEELNKRFDQWSLGYQIIENKVIRQDSKYLHKNTVERSIDLLHDEGFAGASEEFMKSHTHYRNELPSEFRTRG